MNFKKILFSLLLILVTVLFCLFGGIKKFFPNHESQKITQSINGNSQNDTLLIDCSVPELNILPDKFSVVVGHAYGSPTLKNEFIASNLEKFFLLNNKKLINIFFTGDVFNIPSSRKWEKLFDGLGKSVIYVAPGNHDFYGDRSRKIFYSSKAYRGDFPYAIEYDGMNIFVDDSVSSKWELSNKLILEINKKTKPLIVMRHNPPIHELEKFTNSNEGSGNLIDLLQFDKIINNSNDIIWLFGDGGAFEEMPRIVCKRYKNHKFIINGLGDLPNDKILIIHEGNLYSYEI
tara:strand:- start:287 stop:1153 length:867 start_codon:yes stop_codon:yes gene_type:complete